MNQHFYERCLLAADELPSAIGSLFNDLGSSAPPEDGSEGALDAQMISRGEADETFETIRSQAWLLVEAAGDQLFAVSRLLTLPAMNIAPFGSARGVLEASTLLAWLLEQRLDASTRVERSLSLRFRSLEEQLKFMAAWNNPSGITHAKRQIDHIAGMARQRGLPVKIGSGGELQKIGHGVPTATALAAKYFDAEAAFRLLSAVTHAQGSFLLATSFKQSGDGKADKHLTPELAVYLLTNSVQWFSRAAWREFNYNGWNLAALEDVLEATFEKMSVRAELRFWHEQAF